MKEKFEHQSADRDFNHDFMEQRVRGHEAAVKLFTSAADDATRARYQQLQSCTLGSAAYRRGKITRNVVPCPAADCSSMLASSNSHKRLTMESPIPSPAGRREPLVVDCESSVGGGLADSEELPSLSGLSSTSRTPAVASFSSCRSGMASPVKPAPVSCTHSAHRWESAGVEPASQVTSTPPDCVAFNALSTRF